MRKCPVPYSRIRLSTENTLLWWISFIFFALMLFVLSRKNYLKIHCKAVIDGRLSVLILELCNSTHGFQKSPKHLEVFWKY